MHAMYARRPSCIATIRTKEASDYATVVPSCPTRITFRSFFEANIKFASSFFFFGAKIGFILKLDIN